MTTAFPTRLAISLLLAPAMAGAQECAELPEVQQPAERKCGLLSFKCKSEVKAAEEQWQEQMRRFGTTMSTSEERREPVIVSEYRAGGCRGAIVMLELNSAHIDGMQYEVIAPSGTTIATERLTAPTGTALGQPIRLPESGFYLVRLAAQGRRGSREVCVRAQGGRCVQTRHETVYRAAYEVRFRGTADAPPLLAGETAEGTVTAREPHTRRIIAEAGQELVLSVRSSGPTVLCRVERPDGTLLPVSPTATGCEAALPSADRDATYLLALHTTAQAAAGVTIDLTVADEVTVERLPLRLGMEARQEFAAGSGVASHEWLVSFDGSGRYSMTVVPSGLARLELELILYNESTEEVLVDRTRIAARRTIPVTVPAAGIHVLRVTPVAFDQTQSSARYTLLLNRAASTRP